MCVSIVSHVVSTPPPPPPPHTQGKLEEVVEMLSQVVNRPYLRTPQDQIKEIARNVDHTCEEYLNEMKEVATAAALHSMKVFKNGTQKHRPPPTTKLRCVYIQHNNEVYICMY